MDQPADGGVRAPEPTRVPAGALRPRHGQQAGCRAEVRAICRRCFAAARLPMQFVDVDVDPGRPAATVFFASESTVDFRELCRDLGRQLRMRVRLHRLGPRDMAKRTGTCGPCGRGLCCKSFLSGFPAVSVKLVKAQRFPLTPERSAGMCGRLKCCLAYEMGGETGCGTGCRPAGPTGTDQDALRTSGA